MPRKRTPYAELEPFDCEKGAVPLPLGREVFPFSSFDEAHRIEIAMAVEGQHPPHKWIALDHAVIPSRAWYEWHWHRGVDPEKTRQRLATWLRNLVLERDGLVCGLCGGDVEPNDVHVDHIIPVAHGGADLPDNLQVAHSTCNMRKGARV